MPELGGLDGACGATDEAEALEHAPRV
jgi:hypothetical protein